MVVVVLELLVVLVELIVVLVVFDILFCFWSAVIYGRYSSSSNLVVL